MAYVSGMKRKHYYFITISTKQGGTIFVFFLMYLCSEYFVFDECLADYTSAGSAMATYYCMYVEQH